jgi:carboxymethylenebutenolidase
MRGGMIDMESNTTLVQSYPAHEAVPDGQGPFPAVIVAHDRFGLNPHSKGVANRLAAAGFYALAPSFYATPTSVADVAPEYMRPTVAVHFGYDQEIEAREAASQLSRERAEAIFRQAIGYAVTRASARGPVGVLGFSMGGTFAFLAACENPDEVRACVCFYPPGIASGAEPPQAAQLPIDQAAGLRASLLLFYGELDTTTTRQEREAIGRRLTALGKDFRLDVFHDAGADFFLEERDSYRIHASKLAWEATLATFSRCL